MNQTSRTSAARRTRLAQIAGIAFVALTAGAVMLRPGLPERQESPDPTLPLTESDPETLPAALQPPGIDHEDLATRINGIGGVEEKGPVASAPPPDTGSAGDDPPAEEARGWMYLGGIFEPRTSFAFVSVGGTQRIIRAGQELTDLNARVISIDPERIEIEVDGERQRIDRAAPAETMVSVNNAVVPLASPAGVIAPGTNESRMQRDRIQMELESNPDMDKRRAEFLRRQRERQLQEQQR